MAVTQSSASEGRGAAWDVPALVAGGVVSLVITLGATGIASFLNSDSPVRSLLVAVTLGGFVLGAAMAAWAQRCQMPLAHGSVAALGAYAVAETVFVIIKLVRGDSVGWLGLVLKVTLVAGCGLFGSGLGALLRRRGFVPSTERRSS